MSVLYASPFYNYNLTTGTPFSNQIEGAAISANGYVYCANYFPIQESTNLTLYGPKSTFITNSTAINSIGYFDPQNASMSGLFYEDTDVTTHFNGLYFLSDDVSCLVRQARQMNGTGGLLFAADKDNKRILGLDLSTSPPTRFIHCSDKNMLMGVPNDLVVSSKGYTYSSGQIYKANTTAGDGQVWMCTPNGTAIQQLSSTKLGRTNGIALDSRGEYLYLSESFNANGVVVVNRIWKLSIGSDGTLSNTSATPFVTLAADIGGGIDGMRFDMNGNLYVCVNGKGLVLVISPTGSIKNTIKTTFPGSASLTFSKGGHLFIMGRCESSPNRGRGCVDMIYLSDTVGADVQRLSNSSGQFTYSPKPNDKSSGWKTAVTAIFFLLPLMYGLFE